MIKIHTKVHEAVSGKVHLQIGFVSMTEFDSDGRICKTTKVDLRTPSKHRRCHGRRITISFDEIDLHINLKLFCETVLKRNNYTIEKDSTLQLSAYEGIWNFRV